MTEDKSNLQQPAAVLNQLMVVLVEPQGPRNIGSVCRAMANFGVSCLRLVNPQTDHLCHEARQMAVKATTLLEQAEIFTSLEAALADCELAIGTTRRFGKYREGLAPIATASTELLEQAQIGQVAMVFGREDKGLKTEELDLCQKFLTIPTSDSLPSMNLAQSVAVCLYECYKNAHGLDETGKLRKRASVKTQEALFEHMKETLLDIGFLNPQNPEHIMRTFRRIFGRSGLDEREIRVLRGLFSRIDLMQNGFEGGDEG